MVSLWHSERGGLRMFSVLTFAKNSSRATRVLPRPGRSKQIFPGAGSRGPDRWPSSKRGPFLPRKMTTNRSSLSQTVSVMSNGLWSRRDRVRSLQAYSVTQFCRSFERGNCILRWNQIPCGYRARALMMVSAIFTTITSLSRPELALNLNNPRNIKTLTNGTEFQATFLGHASCGATLTDVSFFLANISVFYLCLSFKSEYSKTASL